MECIQFQACWNEHDGLKFCIAHAGLPEEVAIVKSALARSIDVLALTPKEQTYRCWDTEWPSKSEDIPRVRPAAHACLHHDKEPALPSHVMQWFTSQPGTLHAGYASC